MASRVLMASRCRTRWLSRAGRCRCRADSAPALADREGLASIERDRLAKRDGDLHILPGMAEATAAAPPLPLMAPKSSTPDISVART
jgi:hypothetical protein